MEGGTAIEYIYITIQNVIILEMELEENLSEKRADLCYVQSYRKH